MPYPAKPSSDLTPWPLWIMGLLTIGFLITGMSQYHYWDEYFYLYSVYLNEPNTLFKLEPDLGGLFPAGFFTAKAGLIYSLDFLVDSLGPGYAKLKALNLIFFAQTIIFVIACSYLFKQLLPRVVLPFAILCLAFSPLNLYFGGKLLSEIPSLLWLTVACITLLKGVSHSTQTTKAMWVILSAIAVAIACWYRLTTALGMAAFVIALLLANPLKLSPKIILVNATVTAVLSLVLLLLMFKFSDLKPFDSLSGLGTNLAARSHSTLLKIYALGLFGQSFYLLFALGIFGRWNRIIVMAVIWLLITTLPFVFGSSYLEPRFLYLALVPFSILCAFGLQKVYQWFSRGNTGYAVLVGFVALIAINRFILLPVMPYEHDQKRFYQFVSGLNTDAQTKNYYSWLSDFSFARFVSPERESTLTMNWTYNGQADFFSSEALKQWAGEQNVIAEKPASVKPATYIGWALSPVITKLQRGLTALGWNIDLHEGQKNHLSLGWPWQEVQGSVPIADDGHYQAFAYPAVN